MSWRMFFWELFATILAALSNMVGMFYILAMVGILFVFTILTSTYTRTGMVSPWIIGCAVFLLAFVILGGLALIGYWLEGRLRVSTSTLLSGCVVVLLAALALLAWSTGVKWQEVWNFLVIMIEVVGSNIR